MKFQSSEIPQANRLDLVIKLVQKCGSGGLNSGEITEILSVSTGTTYTMRQALYYGDAAVILGLMVRSESLFTLSRQGRRLSSATSTSKTKQIVQEALEENQLINAIMDRLKQANPDPDKSQIITEFLLRHSNLAVSTARRRASTIIRYLEYI
jgi:hypothetical protein